MQRPKPIADGEEFAEEGHPVRRMAPRNCDYPPDDPKIPYGTLWVLDLASNTRLRQIDQLVDRSLKVCSSSPVAVVLV